MSDSDVKELIDRTIGGHEQRLDAFFTKRVDAEAEKARSERIRAFRDKDFRERLAKMAEQISSLFSRDAVDVLGLEALKETVLEHAAIIKLLTEAETKRAGAKAAFVLMWAVGCVVMPLIAAFAYWLITHVH